MFSFIRDSKQRVANPLMKKKPLFISNMKVLHMDSLLSERPTQAGVDLSSHIQRRTGEALSKELQNIILEELQETAKSYQHIYTQSVYTYRDVLKKI